LRMGGTPPIPPTAPTAAKSAPQSDPDATAVNANTAANRKAPSMPSDDDWTAPQERVAAAPAAAVPPVAPVRAASDSVPTAVSNELRDSIDSAVRVAVEQAIQGPLKRWQQDIETRLERVSQSSPGRGVYTGSAPDDPWSPIAPAPGSPGALPTTPIRIDVPLELDGGRRHRNAYWVVAMVILVVLTAFLSAMAVSQATR